MDVVGISAHRQGIKAASARLAVEQGGHFDGVGVEKVQDGGEDALEVDEPVLISPLGGPTFAGGAKQEIRRRPRLKGALGLLHNLILCRLDELDLLAGLLFEGGDDLRDRRVLLRIEPLLPPDDEVGAPGAHGRQDQRGGKDNGANSQHGRLP